MMATTTRTTTSVPRPMYIGTFSLGSQQLATTLQRTTSGEARPWPCQSRLRPSPRPCRPSPSPRRPDGQPYPPIEILASCQVSDGLFGLALHLFRLSSHDLPPSSSSSVPDPYWPGPHFPAWPRRPRPVRGQGPHSQESSARTSPRGDSI